MFLYLAIFFSGAIDEEGRLEESGGSIHISPYIFRNNHAGSPHQDSPRPNSLVHGSVALGSKSNRSLFGNLGSQSSSF
jgi:hypothetical protein